MIKYLHLFNSKEDFESAYNGADYLEPGVSYTDVSEASGMNCHVNGVLNNMTYDQDFTFTYEGPVEYSVEQGVR